MRDDNFDCLEIGKPTGLPFAHDHTLILSCLIHITIHDDFIQRNTSSIPLFVFTFCLLEGHEPT
jgi:hypothetical protein